MICPECKGSKILSSPYLLPLFSNYPCPFCGDLGGMTQQELNKEHIEWIFEQFEDMPNSFIEPSEYNLEQADCVYRDHHIFLENPNGGIIAVDIITPEGKLYSAYTEGDFYLYNQAQEHIEAAKKYINKLLLNEAQLELFKMQ